MPTGPFDKRSKRSRCSPCSSSHLKCDGASPCNQCHRRNITCTYQMASSLIKVDQSKVKTILHFSSKQKQAQTVPSLQVLTLSPTTTDRHLFYFDVFAQRNNFVANTVSYDFDIKTLLGTEPGQYLVYAVSALGALQSSRLNSATSQDDSRAAMKAYASSVATLRDAMAHSSPPSRLHVLWTTLLLGLFELMNNESGDGWLVHMVHGTGAALQASGPSLCMSGLGHSFFLQARVFEVSRALLLGDSTFLSDPQWTALSQGLYSGAQTPGQLLNELLDIIVQCSHLRVKTGTLIRSLDHQQLDERKDEAQALASEGLQLRAALDAWRVTSLLEWHTRSPSTSPYEANLASLCNIYFAAISIFLSGVFDYEILHWQAWGLSVPTLPEEQIQLHVQTILDLISYALQHTTISPLLFLFSLRIVGARSYDQKRQVQVLDLLGRISDQFTVARIFQMELGEVWQSRGSLTPDG